MMVNCKPGHKGKFGQADSDPQVGKQTETMKISRSLHATTPRACTGYYNDISSLNKHSPYGTDKLTCQP